MRKQSIFGTIASNYQRKATTNAVRAGYKALAEKEVLLVKQEKIKRNNEDGVLTGARKILREIIKSPAFLFFPMKMITKTEKIWCESFLTEKIFWCESCLGTFA